MPWTITKTNTATAQLTDVQTLLRAEAIAVDPTLVDYPDIISITLRRSSPGSAQWDVELVFKSV